MILLFKELTPSMRLSLACQTGFIMTIKHYGLQTFVKKVRQVEVLVEQGTVGIDAIP